MWAALPHLVRLTFPHTTFETQEYLSQYPRSPEYPQNPQSDSRTPHVSAGVAQHTIPWYVSLVLVDFGQEKLVFDDFGPVVV